MALPPVMRFTDHREIQSLLRKSRVRFSIPLGRVFMNPRASGRGRILFVISKAVSKKSFERHRVKRRLDSWAERAWGHHPHHWDIIVLISPKVVSLSSRALHLWAEGLLSRVQQMG